MWVLKCLFMNDRYDFKGTLAVHIMVVVGIRNDILF